MRFSRPFRSLVMILCKERNQLWLKRYQYLSDAEGTGPAADGAAGGRGSAAAGTCRPFGAEATQRGPGMAEICGSTAPCWPSNEARPLSWSQAVSVAALDLLSMLASRADFRGPTDNGFPPESY